MYAQHVIIVTPLKCDLGLVTVLICNVPQKLLCFSRTIQGWKDGIVRAVT